MKGASDWLQSYRRFWDEGFDRLDQRLAEREDAGGDG